MRHIAIVGAGIAGLAADRALKTAGLGVTIFDRGERPGGRCSSRYAGGGTFDHGAQYFSARDERFERVVAELVEQGCVKKWQGALVDIDTAGRRPRAAARRYVGVPTMQHLALKLADGLELVSGTRVACARLSGRGWRLFDDHRSELGEYDALVLALPPEQAQALMPPGTSLRLELLKARSLACWALMLGFEQRLPLDFDAAYVGNPELSWVARDSSKPGRPPGERWIVHAAAEWSAARLQHNRADVAAEMLDAFAATVGLDDLRPGTIEAHRWSFARAPRSVASGSLWDDELRLALCGDWCLSPRIEDAYLSGLNAAATLTSQPATVLGDT
jgi:renalase